MFLLGVEMYTDVRRPLGADTQFTKARETIIPGLTVEYFVLLEIRQYMREYIYIYMVEDFYFQIKLVNASFWMLVKLDLYGMYNSIQFVSVDD